LRKELHAWREEVRAKMPTIKPVLDKTTN